MTLTQLRYLVAIADADLNITLAAARVHATQPGLSKQLKLLEDELGFLLFVRKGRSLESITPAGGEVIQRARAVLAEANNIRTYSANQRRESQGQLILATTHTQARFVLPPAIGQIKRAYPQVSVHLQQAGESAALDLLSEGDADIAIISTAGDEPQAGIAVPLYRWRRLVLVPRGHALAVSATPLTLDCLAGMPLISYESSRAVGSSLQLAFAAVGRTAHVGVTARDGDLIRTYVRAGLGVGILAEMALGDDPDLAAPPVAADLLPPCTTWLLLRRDHVLRDYGFALLQVLAPQHAATDLRRRLDHEQPLPDLVPGWADWRVAIEAAAARAAAPKRQAA